ncbi:hypothetical protein L1049_013838 [Liquidambar formosana]|uniref:Late embryogenesis abundant protein LEA-2 subgroup domain-containing protein n=1 Tax=Liquidambar formosana TaxID=63359 RepID=A0AAP0WX62_LIQFO
MNKPQRPMYTNLASCLVAALFLIFVIAVIFTVYISVYKPKNPTIAVNSVDFPAFSISNGVVKSSFVQNVSVRNPNRDAFTHYDSSLELVYSGHQVGFMFIPAGEIDGGRTEHMVARFAIEPFPLTEASSGVVTALIDGLSGVGGVGVGPTFETESRMKLVGRVRVLRFFMHRVESRASCSVVVEVQNGAVLGLRC